MAVYAIYRELRTVKGHRLRFFNFKKITGCLITTALNQTAAASARLWGNCQLFVIFFNIKWLQVPAKPGQKYCNFTSGVFAGIMFGQAPGVAAYRLLQGFCQNIVAIALADEG